MDDENKITYFGQTDARNKKVPFGIKRKDRTKHMYVIGKTGMGKSTLLENLAVQDIQNGEGLAFIDPHGKTAELLLEYIPEHRIKDVLYFAPFDMEYPVSFNVMEDVGADKRHLVVNGLMSTFEKIWVDAWSARMAYILNNTLLALLEYPDATLLGVNRMLADKDFRKKVVDNVTDPSVKSFWIDEFGKYTERFAAEATPAIQNKVGQFTSNPLVRNLIGQPKSSFNIRKIMDEKKILIVNLSKGRVGEGNANLIGSMLITKIYLAAMSRADLTERELKKYPNFYLYVDEFQSFANKSFADILSEARKYKLNLTIAHQYIEQMEEEVRDAVFGNVGTMAAFRVGAYDAEVLEKEFAPQFTAEDLVNLGVYQVYLKLMIDGVGSQPFSATTLAPIRLPSISYKKEIIDASRKSFAQPRAIVEEEIMRWHEQDRVGGKAPVPVARTGESRQSAPQQAITQAKIETAMMGGPARKDMRQPENSASRTQNIPKPSVATPRPQVSIEPSRDMLKNALKQIVLGVSASKSGDGLKPKIVPPPPQMTVAPKPVVSLNAPSHDREMELRKAVSLDYLKQRPEQNESKKQPGGKPVNQKNLDDLRSALAAVMGTPLPAKKAEGVNPPVSTPAGAVSATSSGPATQAQSAPLAPKIPPKAVSESKQSEQIKPKEVPEDVLRKVLKLDEK
jgi:energy-coupling factor transporter ATP-binding protein EcfA2